MLSYMIDIIKLSDCGFIVENAEVVETETTEVTE